MNIAPLTSQEFELPPDVSVRFSSNGGFWSVTITPTVGQASTAKYGPMAVRGAFGPVSEGATVLVTNDSGENLYVEDPVGGLDESELSEALADLGYAQGYNMAATERLAGQSNPVIVADPNTWERGLVIGRDNTYREYTVCAASQTWSKANQGDTATRLTSAAHGLTAASNGRYVFVSFATDPTKNQWAPMTYVSATEIDVAIAWATVSAAGTADVGKINVEYTLQGVSGALSFVVPAGFMGPNGEVNLQWNIAATSSASGKLFYLHLGGTIANFILTGGGGAISEGNITSGSVRLYDTTIRNYGASVQRAPNMSGAGAPLAAATFNTAVAALRITPRFLMAAANEAFISYGLRAQLFYAA